MASIKIYAERNSDLPEIGLIESDGRTWSVRGRMLATIIDGKPVVGDGVKLAAGGVMISGDGRLVTNSARTTTAFRVDSIDDAEAAKLIERYPGWVVAL